MLRSSAPDVFHSLLRCCLDCHATRCPKTVKPLRLKPYTLPSCTLHPMSYIIHTLHPAPCTLHPALHPVVLHPCHPARLHSTPLKALHPARCVSLPSQVGLLDIDICGPSAPKMFGLEGQEVHQSNLGW